MKKIPCIFLIYCLTCSGSLLAQTTQLKIKLDILPSLKALLKDTKCDISIINLETRIQKTFKPEFKKLLMIQVLLFLIQYLLDAWPYK